MTRKSNKVAKAKLRPRSYTGLLVVLLVSIVGGYYLFGVKAYGIDYNITDVARYLYMNHDGTAKGETIAFDVKGYFDTSDSMQTAVFINFNSDRSSVKFLGISGCTIYNCRTIPWTTQLEHQYPTDVVVCLEIPEGVDAFDAYSQPIWKKILKVKYKAVKNLPARSFEWIGVKTASQGGASCDSERPHPDEFTEGFAASCETRGMPTDCNKPGPQGSGPDEGEGGEGKGDDGTGEGTGGGSGGGGGGSSANKQGDKPNTVPSTSNRGDNKQPTFEPSPFFDGKLFAIGSDADIEDIEGVAIAGRTFGFGWLYLFLTLLITGLSGFFGWRWWRKNHR